jgi:hypothetical protein
MDFRQPDDNPRRCPDDPHGNAPTPQSPADDDLGRAAWCLDHAVDHTHGAAERLRAEQEALAVALHEGPVQNFTMLGIRLEHARARLARGEIAETEQALSRLQVALANEISTLRRLLGAARC